MSLTNYFKIEKMVKVTATNHTPDIVIELNNPVKKPVQKSIVACGISVEIDGEDVSDQFA